VADFLVFRLAAAMAATGDIAAQPRRDSERWPARSAVLGVVGAALGLERGDQEAQSRLQSDYDVAVHVRDAGTSLRDYHTVQTVPGSAIKNPDSRPQALAAGRRRGAINTILTNREYREGMYVEVALRPGENPHWNIEALVLAMTRPCFTLYFGRKSCPLTSPVHPVRISADDVVDAFSLYGALEAHAASPERHLNEGFIVADRALALGHMETARVERRWDLALNSEKWHFAEREAYVFAARSESDR